MAELREGGCQCGAIRYRLTQPLGAAYACHCGDCKKQSASAFSLSINHDLQDAEIRGKPAFFVTKTYSGATKHCYFCPECGTRLWHSATNPPRFVTLKVGTLDDPAGIRPVAHLWVSKKIDGFHLDPAADLHDTQPEDMAEWRSSLATNR